MMLSELSLEPSQTSSGFEVPRHVAVSLHPLVTLSNRTMSGLCQPVIPISVIMIGKTAESDDGVTNPTSPVLGKWAVNMDATKVSFSQALAIHSPVNHKGNIDVLVLRMCDQMNEILSVLGENMGPEVCGSGPVDNVTAPRACTIYDGRATSIHIGFEKRILVLFTSFMRLTTSRTSPLTIDLATAENCRIAISCVVARRSRHCQLRLRDNNGCDFNVWSKCVPKRERKEVSILNRIEESNRYILCIRTEHELRRLNLGLNNDRSNRSDLLRGSLIIVTRKKDKSVSDHHKEERKEVHTLHRRSLQTHRPRLGSVGQSHLDHFGREPEPEDCTRDRPFAPRDRRQR